jgi:hypothetical protein
MTPEEHGVFPPPFGVATGKELVQIWARLVLLMKHVSTYDFEHGTQRTSGITF